MSIEFIPLVFMILFGFAMAFIFLLSTEILGARRDTREKRSTYESGMQPVKTARERFTVKFYLVAMLFLIFDIEVIFMYPWAVQFKELGTNGFVAMLLFIILLLAGYVYIIRKGAIRWD